MQPYTVSENDWISNVPLTATGQIDVLALEAAARRERARMVGNFFSRLLGAGKRRAAVKAGAKQVQHELDRAALA